MDDAEAVTSVLSEPGVFLGLLQPTLSANIRIAAVNTPLDAGVVGGGECGHEMG